MLRKLLFSLLLSGPLFVNAQKQVFFCDFSEGLIPENFVVIEGDNQPLKSSATAMYGITSEDGWTCTTADCIAAMYGQMPSDTEFPVALTSSFYESSTVASDNWLITPLIDLSALSSATLSWKAWSRANGSYKESYEVLISETGNSKEDFVSTPVFSIEAEGNSWQLRTVDLSSYSGKQIYIAFHSNTAQGVIGDALAVDDIKVMGTEQIVDESIELKDRTRRIWLEDAVVSASVTAGDFTSIKNFSATLEFEGQEYTESFEDLSVAPGETYDFDMSDKIEFAEGEIVPYVLTVKMNKEEEIIEGEVSFAKDLDFSKNVVVEEITGTWCGNCVAGIVGLRDMIEKYGDSFIPIAIHGPSSELDPMTLDSYITEMHKFLGDSYPRMYVDRKTIGDPNFASIEYEYANEQLTTPLCSVDVEATFENEEMQSFNVESKTSLAFSSNYNPIRLTFVVLENNVQGNSIKYSQSNYYSNDNGLGLEMGGFENMPDPIPYSNIQYQHVARAIIGSFYGTEESLPDVVKIGEQYEYDFVCDVPENVLKSKNLEVVALAVDTVSGEIINAGKAAVKLPTSLDKVSSDETFKVTVDNNILNISFEGTEPAVKVELYSVNGMMLDSENVADSRNVSLSCPESGLYIVKVIYDDSFSVSKVYIE